MSDLHEYIVTLNSHDDVFDFYNDIESPGGTLHIPHRSVECCQRRMNSRNTHYLLTDAEAELIKSDPRVLAVERRPEDIGIVPIRMVDEHADSLFTQTEDTWNKTSSNASTHKNWGLLRCVEGAQRATWGSNGPVNQRSQSGTIQARAEGRNVDVVIVDGMINPAHPEFALNSNGSGGSRVVQYNWFQHNLGQASNTYVYTPYVDAGNANRTADNNHGAHCAGTVAGNTQGWARSANIYNINPYGGTDINNTSSTLLIDYIRAFHNSKPINPATGRRNPTVCNHSWGYGSALAIANITSVTFRGASIAGPFTAAELNSYGIMTATRDGIRVAIRPARVASVDADMVDAFNDGIVMVGAAGNDSTKIDVSGGADFNNFFIWNGFAAPYHRGSTPGAAGGCVCVGAVSALVNETKATFSNCGPRVDILAPGASIMSSFNSTGSFGGTTDPRNSNFFIGKISGTSMASPQVCGVLATVLEVYPNLTPTQALTYIRHYSKLGQMTATTGGFADPTDLQGADNRYLFYYKEREDTGPLTPKNDVSIRPSAGRVFPRVRVRR